MASKKNPSIFSTLQKTTANASAVNGEFPHQIPLDALEDNPLNRFSMAEDEEFLSTMHSMEKDGLLEDIIVTPSDTEGRYRIISGHRRVHASRKLGRATVPCKIRHYDSKLSELRALMGANIHRRNISAFDMARQLETLRSALAEEGGLPDNVKEQSELMASQVDLSRATVERYLDLLNLDETVTAWAENGQMTMTDAYELARQKNIHLQPVVEEYVARNDAKGDLPALVHRAIAWAKTAELPPPPAKPAQSANPLRTMDSFGRSVRRSTAQLKALDLSVGMDKDAARKKLCDLLCNYQGFQKCVLILVFDAYRVPGSPGSIEQYHNIHVVYTKEAETADMFIEHVTHEIGKGRRVRVATSDGMEQIIILGHGALRVSARMFHQEVQEAEKEIRKYLQGEV